MVVLALLACGPAPDTATPSTGAPAPPVYETSCALVHPMVATCQVRLETAAPVSMRFLSDRGQAWTFESTVAATEHTITAWGLGADTEWTWSHDGRSGSLRTEALPAELAGITVEVSGELFGFDAVLRVMQCAQTWFLMFDERGQIVWYTPTEVYTNPTNGYEWSQADRSLLQLAPRTLLETGVAGDPRLRLEGATDFFGKNLHHDLTRWGPYTYALFDEPAGNLRADGILVFEGTTLVGTFRLSDTYPVPGTGVGDWAHANGINAASDGVIALSLRNFDMVLGIDGDPSSPSFLEILWTADGSGEALGQPTFVAPPGFAEGWRGQHNPHIDGDRLTLFDNHGDGSVSRAARYHLDASAGQAVHERSWYLDEDCAIQSGAVPVEGGILVSCAASGRVSLFREEATQPSFELDARCPPGGFVTAITRGIPVSIR